MADNNDQDLVSQIVVTGDGEAAKAIENYADKGAAAFDKLSASAGKASAGVEKATDAIGKNASEGQKKVEVLNRTNLDGFREGMLRVKDAADRLGDSFPKLAQAAGRFAQRMTIVAAAAVAAGTHLASVAKRVATAVDGQSDSLDKQTQSQIDANNRALSAEEAQINLAASYRKLNEQLRTGKITYQQYADAVKQLNLDYNDQRLVANQVANAQERVKEENDRLTKSLADRKAYQGLVDEFGGPLVSSLTAFGHQIGAVHTQLLGAFGPAIAALIDKIGSILAKNSGAINSFFNEAGAKISQLVNQNGPQLERFFENVGSAAASIINGLIAAAPALIDFFNNSLIPAGRKVASVFQTVADAINAVFGTRLTGGSIFIVAVLAQVTGSIRVLFALTKASGLVFKGILGVLEPLGIAFAKLFGGGKVTTQLITFTAAVTKSSNPLKLFFNIIKSGIPLIVTLAEILATTLGVSFAVALPIVVALGAALLYLATKIDWKKFGKEAGEALISIKDWLITTWNNAKAAANGIRGAWQGLVNWFGEIGKTIGDAISNIWEGAKALASDAATGVQNAWDAVVKFFSDAFSSIGSFFSNLWTGIKTAASAAAQYVITAWNAVIAFFAPIAETVGAAFTLLWTNIQTAATAAVKNFTDAWNAVVGFFSGILDQVKSTFNSVMDGVVAYWNSGIEQIKGFFSALYSSALQYLKPILDLLNSIAQASASDTSSTDNAGYAEGGAIRGPGTGTSDSIPAWLSNGEFVMRAAAVRKYGSSLMHAINSGGWRGFAAGGMIGGGGSGPSSPAAALVAAETSAGGGGNLSPLNLTLFGEQFPGLMMPEDVGRRLTKFAIQKQTSSAGRKPSWVGGGRS